MAASDFKHAFILHLRPYKENQALIELLIKDVGRITAISYRGSKKNTGKNALLQPFKPLLVQYKESKGLQKLTLVEENSALTVTNFVGKPQFCGFYLNEIICRLCPAGTYQETLYDLYWHSISQLVALQYLKEIEQRDQMQVILRRFEYRLLVELGYGLDLTSTLDTHEKISAHHYYQLYEGSGFVEGSATNYVCTGAQLAALEAFFDNESEQQVSSEVLRLAKRVLRQCLQLHLGDKPIKSRELFK